MPSSLIPAQEAASGRARRQAIRRRVVVVVFAFPVLLLAIALYLAFGPQPPRAPVVVPVSPERAAQAEQHVNSVWQALHSASVAGPIPSVPVPAPTHNTTVPPRPQNPVRVIPGPTGLETVSLRLSQSDINAFLSGNKQMHVQLMKHGVRAVSVALASPSNVAISAAATFHRVSGNALVTCMLVPDPKTGVALNVTGARFGRFPPPLIKAAAAHIVNDLMGKRRRSLPLAVRSVKVVGTDLIITGTRKLTTGNFAHAKRDS